MRGIVTMAGTAVALAAMLAAPPAIAQDEVLARTLVETYCGSCHAIERTGSSPHPAAPPLRTLNERYDVELLGEALVEGLVSGHPDMPEFAFDPAEAEAIIQYLKWLAR